MSYTNHDGLTDRELGALRRYKLWWRLRVEQMAAEEFQRGSWRGWMA